LNTVRDLDKADPGLHKKLLKLHLPPTGGDVERGRLVFYLQRAAETRFSAPDEDGKRWEVKPAPEFILRYEKAMDRLFIQRKLARAKKGLPASKSAHSLDWWSDYDKVVDRDVFDVVWASVNKDSSPGYPLVYLAKTNEDLDVDIVYDLVNETLRKWLDMDIEKVDLKDRVGLFGSGASWPTMAFVKMEPTDEGKIARLIFGVSVVMNVIGRLLFGDYVGALKDTWSECQHKVGLDMYSVEGLELARNSFSKLFALAEKKGVGVVSDDVQGWEYQVRTWMSHAWYKSYMKYCVAEMDCDLTHLIRCYVAMEGAALCITSSGEVFNPPFHITASGKFTTHIENTDTRAALADTINGFEELDPEELPSATNGDDCVSLDMGQADVYVKLGFKITDQVSQSLDAVKFCSQVFTDYVDETDGKVRWCRKPDGLAKPLYNAIVVQDKVDALLGIYSHVRNHPGASLFYKANALAFKLLKREENAELPFKVDI